MQRHHFSRLSMLRRCGCGFSLIELMVVISVVAVLAAVATPSFNQFILSQRVKAASFDLVSTQLLARSEAIKRNTDVTVALKSTTSGWAGGWTVSYATSAAPTTPITLLDQTAYTGITIVGPTSPASVIYKGTSGRPNAGKATFQLSADSAIRCVTVDLSGMTGTKTGTCT